MGESKQATSWASANGISIPSGRYCPTCTNAGERWPVTGTQHWRWFPRSNPRGLAHSSARPLARVERESGKPRICAVRILRHGRTHCPSGSALGGISVLGGSLRDGSSLPSSVPLVLIVGLVGFGLFGALVSSFIRAREREGPTDLFAVICIGGSAAIVIFLAAYGGIVVMAQSEHDPNAYVLFLTCLVAAVFGEDVWRWARRRFVPQEEELQSENLRLEPRRDPGAGWR